MNRPRTIQIYLLSGDPRVVCVAARTMSIALGAPDVPKPGAWTKNNNLNFRGAL